MQRVIALVFLLPFALPAQNPSTVDAGQTVFRRDCAFCHGRDAGGGESGPDLTRSKLVADDVAGKALAPMIRGGRPDRGMPAFHLPDDEMAAVVAYLHNQMLNAEKNKGGRKGVDESDLHTGNAEAGKQYFDKACRSCHSPAGDFAGLASRLKGLRLEQRMLYPRGAKATARVTLPGGQTVSGTLAYRDEFTVALRDSAGKYRSWSTANVKVDVSDPAEAHVELLPKYSDDDIHNLMAYLQTLR